MRRGLLERLATVNCRWLWIVLLPAVAVWIASCGPQKKAEAPEPRPVRTVTAERQDAGDKVVLTGHIQAEDEAAMAFRIGGRMTDRFVNVGDQVKPGQELARLDPQNEVNALRSAQASLTAAQAQLTQARAAFERQRTLLAQGHTPRAQFDLAEKALRTAQAQVDDGEVQVRIAADRVSYTGTSGRRGRNDNSAWRGTWRSGAGRADDRSACPPRRPRCSVRCSRPGTAVGTKRLAGNDTADRRSNRNDDRPHSGGCPQADPVTRTFQVKVGLTDPPTAMRLGSTVNGSVQLEFDAVIAIPASALTELNRQPAVWIVDPSKLTVSLRNIELLRFDPGTVIVAHGLETGDIVVTAGVQALHPGQTVRLLGPSA